MSQTAEDLGDVCCVLLATDRDWRYVAADEFNKLDAIYCRYISTGKTYDEIVHTENPAGSPIVFAASEIRGLQLETRDQRRAMREWAMALEAEKKADGILE